MFVSEFFKIKPRTKWYEVIVFSFMIYTSLVTEYLLAYSSYLSL